MEITKGFITAVELGANALRSNADAAEQEDEAKADTNIGRIVRTAIEESRQSADMLYGWSDRARAEIGWPRDGAA